MSFSRKLNKSNDIKVYFNNAPVSCANWQKHLRIYLHESLKFSCYIKEKMSKAMKGIAIITKRNRALPQHSFITIYKSFVRPRLDYGDIIYNQPNKERLNQKTERIQYNAALAITGTYITYQGRSYNELGVEFFKVKRCFRKLCTFYKIKTTGVPQCLSHLIPQTNHLYNTCVERI